MELARASVERAGVSTRGMSNDEVLHRAAGMHTTSDFPLMVKNAVNKVALDAFRAAESPIKQLARRQTLNEFIPSPAVRLGELGRLAPMEETAEFVATRAESHQSGS